MSRLTDMDYARIAEERRETIWADLRHGYGVEDIRVRHGIPEEFSREVIRHWRKTGALRFVVRG